MAMGGQKNNDRVPVSKVDEAIKLLQDLKPKERDDVSDREAVRQMRRYIEKLTSSKYGYTYDEVSEMLKGLGINLTGSRIKYLIGELKKSSRRRQKTSLDDNNQSENLVTETQPTVNASGEADKLRGNSEKGKKKINS
jgi:hypothetical protein